MTAQATWEAGVAEAHRRYPAKYEAAAEAREVARPTELPINPSAVRTPAMEYPLRHGPGSATAAKGRDDD